MVRGDVLNILIVGNINWFNLRDMHIKPLINAGYKLTVLSDVEPDSPDYIKGVDFIHLNKRRFSIKGWLYMAKQLFSLLVKGRLFVWKERARVLYLYQNSLKYLGQVNAIQQDKFDLVHCHFLTRPACITLYLSNISLPIISTIHGSDLYVSAFNTIVDRSYIELSFLRSTNIVVPGSSEEELLVKLGGASKKVVKLPWGIDTSFFTLLDSEDSQELLKERWGFANKQVLLSTRNHASIYNIQSIIKAFSSFSVKEDTILVIAGNGEQTDELQSLVKKYKLIEMVIFTGRLTHNELKELYQLSDVYVQNPLSDALPYSMLEAIACGCSVVCGELGSIVDLVTNPELNEQSSLFFSGEGVLNDHELSKLLTLAMTNGRKKYFSIKYQSVIDNNYSLSAYTSKISNIYQSLLKVK